MNPLVLAAALAFIEQLLNPWLRLDPRVLAVLGRHAGARLRLCATAPRVQVTCTLERDGVRLAGSDDAPVDVELRGSPQAVLRVLAGDEEALGELDVSGNVRLLQQLSGALAATPFDPREPLASLFGEEAAIYLAALLGGAGRALRGTANRARTAARDAVAPVVAAPDAVERHFDAITDLRLGIDRLAARIAALEARRPGPATGTR